MLSQTPTNLEKVKKAEIDREIARIGMIAELDAISFYEQLAAMTENKNIKKVLFDIAKEENSYGRISNLIIKRRQGTGKRT